MSHHHTGTGPAQVERAFSAPPAPGTHRNMVKFKGIIWAAQSHAQSHVHHPATYIPAGSVAHARMAACNIQQQGTPSQISVASHARTVQSNDPSLKWEEQLAGCPVLQ